MPIIQNGGGGGNSAATGQIPSSGPRAAEVKGLGPEQQVQGIQEVGSADEGATPTPDVPE